MSAPGALSTAVTSVLLYSLTRATLMSPGKDETRVCRYIYLYIYIYILYIYLLYIYLLYIYIYIYIYNFFPTSFGRGRSQEICRICDLQVLKDI